MPENAVEKPLVSIIIVNFNGESYLQTLFESLAKCSYPNLEIVFVDNCSHDGSINFVERNYPSVKVLKNPENYMFARGNNEGIKIAGGKYICLLNNDTEVDSKFLEPLVDFFENHEEFGAAQPKILDINRKDHLEYAGACGGYLDIFGYPFLQGRIFNVVEVDRGQYDNRVEIFWASGACIFLRKKALEDAGVLDEDFQLHMEEIDLCWRLHLQGWRIASIPQARIWHHGGGTLSQFSPRKVYYNFRNNIFLIIKNFSLLNLVFRFPVRVILDIVAFARSLLIGEFAMAFAIIKSYIWILSHSFLILRKRREVQQTRTAGEREVLKTIYPGSIVFEFFVLQRRKFSDLLLINKFSRRINSINSGLKNG